MRPRLRSYGDNSTFTLSPGLMRMRKRRILPQVYASVSWPLSSPIRYIPERNDSSTSPSNSIFSSLSAMQWADLLYSRESWSNRSILRMNATLEPLEIPPKPRLRGVLHQTAFAIALVAGTLLVVFADGRRASLAAAIFAGSVAAMLGMSALYHRITWSPRVRPWM